MLYFVDLTSANAERMKEWPGSDQIDPAFRTLEVAGEAGELAEAMKKYLRAQRGIGGSTADLQDIADEIGDVVIAVDLLASALGLDLAECVRQKFNKTSDKYGLKTKF